tara:strand:- start:86 stop:409 length:324 start_codon:yes stop_codon:yes gene_type:complete
MSLDLWIISDKHKTLFIDMLSINIYDVLKRKINAQIDYNYDLENLDYSDKPFEARVFNDHLYKLENLNREYKHLCSVKNYFLKQLILEGKVFKRLPEDVLKYIVGYM